MRGPMGKMFVRSLLLCLRTPKVPWRRCPRCCPGYAGAAAQGHHQKLRRSFFWSVNCDHVHCHRTTRVVCVKTTTDVESCPQTVCVSAWPESNDKIRVPVNKLQGRMLLSFLCKLCSTRAMKLISKVSYEKGIVVIKCHGCSKYHLIADNLGWFPEPDGKRNIEEILASKGEAVRKALLEDEILEVMVRERRA
ncbi:hypothetical protein MRX96_021482 [Rhipicephalus microplus]|uniref:uncharacterized protein LOC142777110 n=1 Tax=Rhipicephalus microplus TaxID=6941 RepID=UPI003F6D67E5